MQPYRRLVSPARRASLAVCSALALGGLALSPLPAAARATHHAAAAAVSLKPLSARDARLYTEAFAAIHDGRFDEGAALAKSVSDPLLKGRLAYAKLMQSDYPASYDELADWLERYHDQPGAEAIYALARKRKPAAAPALAAPDAAAGGDPAIWAQVETVAQHVEATSAPAPIRVREPTAPTHRIDPALQSARDALYKGEVEHAYTLAVAAGERWIAGLAAFRLKHYDEAQSRFGSLALDQTEDEWTRSGAGYWAARSAIAAGSPEAAPAYLQLAAKTPYTFYGLIAERQLGLDPAVTADGLDPAVAPQPATPGHGAIAAATPRAGSAAELVRDDKRARRAAAYAQLGMHDESGAELRAGLMGAAGPARQGWIKLGLALNAPLTSPADLSRGGHVRFDLAQYPTPDLAPAGGFTLDKALVYALVRQESKFDPAAASAGGAYGLMQLTPATAARVAGDNKLKSDPSLLKDPALNLRLGQDYVAHLLTALDGDLLKAVAAYNAGPGAMQKTLAQIGKNADSLLAIESMPAGQTRDYVEKVVAGYWIYRNIFGQDSPTLDAAAGAKRKVAAALDRPLATTITAKLAPEVLGSFFQPAAD